jgi:enoyl-CoA hydratase/carnithine racemase
VSLIEYKKENKIAIFTINNPKALGALNVQAMNELHDALVSFRDDEDLCVGILTGTGEKAFSVGVDIGDFLPFAKKVADKMWLMPGTLMRRLELWKPMIAACNGLTYGGGFEMALGCDIRIASENAKFCMPEVTLGVFPGGGGTQRLPRIIPKGIALEMLLTGKPIDAKEAYRIGLVNRITPPDQLMNVAMKIAEDICQNGPVAVRAVKEAVLRGGDMSIEDGLRLEEYFSRIILQTNDCEEGIAAFFQKRKPNFQSSQNSKNVGDS